MDNMLRLPNDIYIFLCSILVFIVSILIYKKVRCIGWKLMIISWGYMVIIRAIWLYDTIKNIDIKESLGSLLSPHWTLISVSLIVFLHEIKKIKKG